jgi:hypothetical protein
MCSWRNFQSHYMSEFLTAYPRRINIVKGLQDFIHHEDILLDHLSLAVKVKRKEELIRALIAEGFRKVKLENRKPYQIGSGFSKRLKSPWELHLRLLNLQKGMIGIHAEVEISRKYIQHIRSVRSPVIYEIESILKKHKIEYKIWNARVRAYITNIIDNHQIKLRSPRLGATPWKPMMAIGITLAIVYAIKFMRLF